jgi:hypothetical protein
MTGGGGVTGGGEVMIGAGGSAPGSFALVRPARTDRRVVADSGTAIPAPVMMSAGITPYRP